jgi:type IV secretory pathway TraG/TraD family ATPase VirD4
MPATQVYFKQKTFSEARELSEAIGRTTIEEATVNDNGRVQEMIQGRALITPDELIGLKNEVVIFAPDSNPLKLPLISPTAYDNALRYDPPERERHKVTEFVRKRGYIKSRVLKEDHEANKETDNRPWRKNKFRKQQRYEQNKKNPTNPCEKRNPDRNVHRQSSGQANDDAPDFD